MITVLITGALGQVGQELLRNRPASGFHIVATDLAKEAHVQADEYKALDLSSEAAIDAICADVKPALIINPGAYTAVDKAESEPDSAAAVNVRAPARLAAAASRLGAGLIHYSTDYVFDGSGNDARDEDSPTNPLSVYGQTKLAGEAALLQSHDAAVIFRTSWVFSAVGHNFVKTMLRLGAERSELKVVADQIGAPTSARLLAQATWHVIQGGSNPGELVRRYPGIYHLTCRGAVSWHGFAKEIFAEARLRGFKLAVETVEPIRTSSYPTPARRPLNSRLACDKFQTTFAYELPRWQDELTACLDQLLES